MLASSLLRGLAMSSRQQALVCLGLLAASLPLAACGSEEAGIDFTVEQQFLPDFELDTGFLPADQPAQVRVVARAGGTLTMAALADVEQDALVPLAESGLLGLEAEMQFDVHVNVDTAGFKFNELVKSFGYAIPATSIDFTPFLLDSAAALDIDLPAQDIGDIPLGSIPGSLRLSVEGGSVQIGLQGTCAEARDGLAQFMGVVTGGGRIEIGATIVVTVPVFGDKEFGPIIIPVDLPSLNAPIDFGTFEANGSSASVAGPCTSGPADDPTGSGGDGGGSGGDGSGDGGASEDNCGLPAELKFTGVNLGSGWVDSTNTAFQFGDFVGLPDPYLGAAFMAGQGIFANGVTPGVYPLTSSDADFASCNGCIFVGTDLPPDGTSVLDFAHVLLAESGTITLSSVSSEEISGTISDVVLREMGGTNAEQEVPNGCRTYIPNYSFQVALSEY